MSGAYVSFSLHARSAPQQREELEKLARHAFHGDDDVIDTISDPHAVGLLVRHRQELSWGVSSLLRNRYRLILCGYVWAHESAQTLCDPDEALELLLRRDAGLTQTVCGQYLAIILDQVERRTIVENNLFGVVPCYYHADRDGLIVSSELKAFREFVPVNIDQLALAELARLGSIITDRSILSDVRRLPPNHRLNFDQQGLRIETLSFPAFTRSRVLDDDTLDEMDAAFDNYLTRIKSRTSKVSASLSGGLDSRIAVAALVRRGFDVTCFSSGEVGSQECRVAAQFSKLLGLGHVIHEYDGRGFPEWFPSAIWLSEDRCHPTHMHFMDAMVSGNFPKLPQFHGLIGDVVVGGDLDEQLGADSLTKIDELCRAKVLEMKHWHPGSAEAIWGKAFAGSIEEVPNRIVDYVSGLGPWSDPYSRYLWFRYIFRLFGIINPCLAGQVLPWTPFLAPYIDPALFRISASLRMSDIAGRAGQIRWALRAYPEVARIPRVKDGALVPVQGKNVYDDKIRGLLRMRRLRYLLSRATRGRVNFPEREGYPNYNQWYRRWSTVRDYVDQTLLSRRSLERGLWDGRQVRLLLDDLRVGWHVWNAVATLLKLEVLLGQLEGDSNPVSSRIELAQ